MSLYKNVMDQIRLDAGVQEKLKELYKDGAQNWTTHTAQAAQKKPRTSFKRFATASASVAACAAVAVMLYDINTRDLQNNAGSEGSSSVSEVVSDIASDFEHKFTLKVLAAEGDISDAVVMEKGKPVITTETAKGGGYGISPGTQECHYKCEYCFLCEGEHIEKITYSVNKGVLQICELKDRDSIAVESEPAPYEDYGKSIRHEDGQEEHSFGEYNNLVYHSYTVAYDYQVDPYTIFSVCGKKSMDDVDYEHLNLPHDLFDVDYEAKQEFYLSEEHVNALKQLMGDVVITCTIHYDDGTSESADIKVVPRIMTYREQGFADKFPWMSDESLDRKDVHIAYELQ